MLHKRERLCLFFNNTKSFEYNLNEEKKKRKKEKNNVRSGIRTHAYKSRLRPERSALDRSAILTSWDMLWKYV